MELAVNSMRGQMIRMTSIRPLSEFQRNTKAHIQRLTKTGQPEVLTVNGKAKIGVQDAGPYQKLLDHLDLLESVEAVREGLEQAKRGEGRPIREVMRAIAARNGFKLRDGRK